VGEALRYQLSVANVVVGTIDFQISGRSRRGEAQITEYRSLFTLDALAAALLPVQGRAAARVPDTALWPQQMMNRYKISGVELDETVTLDATGHILNIKRKKAGVAQAQVRQLPTAVLDFVTGFYALRRLPQKTSSCALIYGNERLYTVWLQPHGIEEVKTPIGLRPALRLDVRFASERAKKTLHGRLWLGTQDDLLPLRAEIDGSMALAAQLHRFDLGQPESGPAPAPASLSGQASAPGPAPAPGLAPGLVPAPASAPVPGPAPGAPQ
jgi:hypothetical protein